MWPFLVDNLKEVIRELQDFAEKKYNAEEAECPQRVVRLSTANNGPGLYNNSNRQPRTFSDITNEKHVFIRSVLQLWDKYPILTKQNINKLQLNQNPHVAGMDSQCRSKTFHRNFSHELIR